LDAAKWYLKHDVALADSRVVQETSYGPLRAYRTRSLRGRPSLLIYFTVREGGLAIALEQMLASKQAK